MVFPIFHRTLVCSDDRSPQRGCAFAASLSRAVRAIVIVVLFLGAASLARGATIEVPAGGDFQGAISAANCGDEIVLAAGATFTGNFILRDKGLCSDYIIIRSSNPSGLPAAGTRITPSYAS